jgi:hypothetical protein
MRRLRLVFVAILLSVPAGWVGASDPVEPDAYVYRALIDSDKDEATGCDVDAHDDNFPGPVKGIEFIVEARVLRFPAHADVTEVVLSTCDSGTDFFPPNHFELGGWPVSLETGEGGADVIEFYVPRALIGNPPSMRLGFHASRAELNVNDVLLTRNGTDSGLDIVFPAGVPDVPLLSRFALGLVIVIFSALAWWSLRRRGAAAMAAGAAACIITLAATGWAVTIVLDGMLGDWAGVPPIAQDVLNDSTADDPAEDIVVAFVTADAQNIYFRLDQVNLCPVMCGNGVLESGEQCEVPQDCEPENEVPGMGSGAFVPACLCTNCTCSPGCFDERLPPG